MNFQPHPPLSLQLLPSESTTWPYPMQCLSRVDGYERRKLYHLQATTSSTKRAPNLPQQSHSTDLVFPFIGIPDCPTLAPLSEPILQSSAPYYMLIQDSNLDSSRFLLYSRTPAFLWILTTARPLLPTPFFLPRWQGTFRGETPIPTQQPLPRATRTSLTHTLQSSCRRDSRVPCDSPCSSQGHK